MMGAITGTIGFCTDQGLGIQTKAFIDHGVIDKILIQRHGSYENHHDWYTDQQKANTIEELLKCDRLIFFETLWDKWKIIPMARERGIKTIFIPHYECSRFPPPYWPDIIVCPSSIDYEYWKDSPNPVHRINIPVDMTWRQRTKARVFVHNAGHGGIGGRNGTKELLEAMQYVKSPIRLLLRAQNGHWTSDDPRVEITLGSLPYEALWATGDVFILPEKFGGSFLPMQEACAAGMMVMASDRSSNHWLPREGLIPVSGYTKEHISVDFDSAIIKPEDIAAQIDRWYNQDIGNISLLGKQWAKQNSWNVLKKRYEAL